MVSLVGVIQGLPSALRDSFSCRNCAYRLIDHERRRALKLALRKDAYFAIKASDMMIGID